MENLGRTALLLAAMTAIFLGAGWLIGGQSGMVIALLIAGATNLFAYWNSDRMVLSMYGAQEVDHASAPNLVGIVSQLAANAGLPMPRVYVFESEQPNAFATGRDPEHAAVAASTGLLHDLSHEEIAGVMAHELAHVRHRDTLTMTVTATIAGAIGFLGNFAFFMGGNRDGNNQSPLGAIGTVLAMLVAPLAAMLVQMAISRAREYEADRLGAEICGQPLWLASALERLEQVKQGTAIGEAERNPATAHMFILNPLHGGALAGLFSTHPSTEERVARLHAMVRGGYAPARSPWG